MIKDKYTHLIKQKYVTSSKSRTWEKAPYRGFIVAHDTGNPGSSAAGNVNWMNSEDKVFSSAHVFIDHKEIIEDIPLDEKAWHVLYNITKDNEIFGDDANDIAIGVELCFGGSIDTNKAYDMYCWYHAYLCKRYKLDPTNKITGHYKLDPARKTDPITAFQTIGVTWDKFIADVKAYYDAWEGDSVVLPENPPVVDNPNPPSGGDLPEDLAGKRQPIGVAVINTASLRVRAQTNTSSTIIRSVLSGERWNVYEISGDWLRIHDGWIHRDYANYESYGFAADSDTPEDLAGKRNPIGVAQINCDVLNVRSKPTTEGSRIITKLSYKDRWKVYDVNGQWLRIHNGWIHRDFVIYPA